MLTRKEIGAEFIIASKHLSVCLHHRWAQFTLVEYPPEASMSRLRIEESSWYVATVSSFLSAQVGDGSNYAYRIQSWQVGEPGAVDEQTCVLVALSGDKNIDEVFLAERCRSLILDCQCQS